MSYGLMSRQRHDGTTSALRESVSGQTNRESSISLSGMENAMRCDLCNREVTDGSLLCQRCADVIPPFAFAAPVPGSELALALAAELAPYLTAD